MIVWQIERFTVLEAVDDNGDDDVDDDVDDADVDDEDAKIPADANKQSGRGILFNLFVSKCSLH